MPPTIALSKPDLTQREADAAAEVVRSGVLSDGPQTEAFERACAQAAGRRHAVAVSSGAAGLHLALVAAGIKPGDQVVTTPLAFIAAANAVLAAGGRPVFVDVDPKTLNADPKRVEAAVDEHTRGVLAVAAHGHPGGLAEQEALARRNELVLVEDASEGFGGHVDLPTGRRRLGSFGRAGVFDFGPDKPVVAGEAGAIVTDDDKLADVCRSLRNHGRDLGRDSGRDGPAGEPYARLGYGCRLTELAAAVGVVQVDRLAEVLAARRRIADLYMRRLMGQPDLILPNRGPETGDSWAGFVVRLSDRFGADDRDALIRRLRGRGVGCAPGVPPIHLQPFYRDRFGFGPGDFPMCESIAARTLALPFHAGLSDHDLAHVSDALDAEIDKLNRPRG